MLERFGMHLRLGVSPAAVTLVRVGRRARQCQLLVEQPVAPVPGAPNEGIAAALQRLFDAYDGARLPLRLVLADGLVRHWMVTPPQNALHQSDCQAAAAMRFQTLYGEPLDNWRLAADWDARQPFLACALPGALLDTLQRAAAVRQLPVLEIAPQFVTAWNRWRRAIAPQAWFGLVGADTLTLAVPLGARLHAMRAATLPAAAWQDAAALARHLTREALRLDTPLPALLHLCGALADDLPQSWSVPLAADANGAKALQCTRLDTALQLHGVHPSPGVQLALTGAWT